MDKRVEGPSEIRSSYFVDLEDVVLLYRYTMPIETHRWLFKVGLGATIIGLLALGGAVWLFTMNSWALTPKAAAAAAFGIIATGLGYQSFRASHPRPMRERIQEPHRSRLLKLETYKGAMGQQVLTLTPGGVSEDRDHATISIDWSGIARVITTPSHTFIVQSTGGRFILPHAALTHPINSVVESIEGWWGHPVERLEM
jgi:hypothetical protein